MDGAARQVNARTGARAEASAFEGSGPKAALACAGLTALFNPAAFGLAALVPPLRNARH